MSLFLLLVILGCVVGVIIMSVHLIERVRTLERKANLSHTGAAIVRDTRFEGLEGEQLWIKLSGTPVPVDGPDPLADLRELYAPVLQRHIEEVFQEGILDGRLGMQLHPDMLREIKTTGGEITSWIPEAESHSVYALGVKKGLGGEDPGVSIREQLDAITVKLYEAVGLAPKDALAIEDDSAQAPAESHAEAPAQLAAPSMPESLPDMQIPEDGAGSPQAVAVQSQISSS